MLLAPHSLTAPTVLSPLGGSEIEVDTLELTELIYWLPTEL